MIVLIAVAALASMTNPAEASGNAIMQCVAHVTGVGEISSANATAMAANGLELTDQPPPFLAPMAQNDYGKGSFAHVGVTEGEVWAIGYDSGTCIVMTLGTLVEPIEQRITAMFGIPGAWVKEPIKQTSADVRWVQYGWTSNGRRLTAQMNVRPLSDTAAKGMVMVTIVPRPLKLGK